MGRIRQKTSKPKINAFSEYKSQGCFSEQYPWLSFTSRISVQNVIHDLQQESFFGVS